MLIFRDGEAMDFVGDPYATQGSNPGRADRVPGGPATHVREPRLGQAAGDTAVNLAIDLAAMAGTGTFWRNENAARESRLARLAQGANIAALRAQVLGSGDAQFVRLADFRSGRGEARRVVLVVAEEAALKASMVEAAAAAPQIAAADFLVVPVSR